VTDGVTDGPAERPILDPADLDAFAARADELEARIAEAEARGEELPAQARAMLASLRELARAVDGLRATLGDAAPPEEPPGSAG
jgi:hypothetical protein